LRSLSKGVSYGYKETNYKGQGLWDDMKTWHDKHYMTFMGTDDNSWIANHAYSLIWAKEITLDGQVQRWVKIRNPWGSH